MVEFDIKMVNLMPFIETSNGGDNEVSINQRDVLNAGALLYLKSFIVCAISTCLDKI